MTWIYGCPPAHPFPVHHSPTGHIGFPKKLSSLLSWQVSSPICGTNIGQTIQIMLLGESGQSA